MNIIFIIPAYDDVTKILSGYCQEIIDKINQNKYPNINFKVLKAEESTFSKLEETLNQINLNGTNIIVFYGHAEKEYLKGMNKIPIIDNSNINKMKDWHFFVVSCYSITRLGKYAITVGIKSYIGYEDVLLIAEVKENVPEGLKECLNKGIEYSIQQNNYSYKDVYNEIIKEYRYWINYHIPKQ